MVYKSSGQASLNQEGNVKEFGNWNVQCAESSYPVLSLVTNGSKEQDGLRSALWKRFSQR